MNTHLSELHNRLKMRDYIKKSRRNRVAKIKQSFLDHAKYSADGKYKRYKLSERELRIIKSDIRKKIKADYRNTLIKRIFIVIFIVFIFLFLRLLIIK